METQRLAGNPDDLLTAQGEPVSRRAVREQLERLVESKHFRNSRRYPALLRFVVEQVLEGHAGELKERTLGLEVFARPNNYDTNADPVVRVTAGEIRKRLAQYYQDPGHEGELRIVLPLGAYVPQFLSHSHAIHSPVPEEPEAVAPRIPKLVPAPVPVLMPVQPPADRAGELSAERRPARWGLRRWSILAALLLVLLLAAAVWRSRHAQPGLSRMWQPVLNSPAPALLVIGVHSLDSQGNEKEVGSHAAGEEPGNMLAEMVRSDMVPVSDIVSYSRLTDLLTRHAHSYTTMAAADATLEQVRNGPLVLVGGLDNLWTLRLAEHLRFRFQADNHSASSIVDMQHPERRWTFDNLQKPIGSTKDFALVASYFDESIEQPVVIVAGIGKAGTLIASEFCTSDGELRSWMQLNHAAGRNMELVLETDILDGKAGPPRVVASAIW